MVLLARRGSPAKVIYELLESRGFKIKSLEEMKRDPCDENHDAASEADALLSYAQKSGSPDLMRYLVKDLGMVSTAGRMESLEAHVDMVYAVGNADGVPPPRTDLKKYKCAACEFVGATEFCSGCGVPRYCSKECQRKHWKTGGHKQECKENQRRMRSEEGDKEGSSSAAGSS